MLRARTLRRTQLRTVQGTLLWVLLLTGCATTPAPIGTSDIEAELRAAKRLGGDGVTSESRAQQLFIRGMTQAQVGNHAAALDYFAQALAAAPNTPAILSAAAESHEAVGDETSAIYNARLARDLAPENPHYHFQLAQLHLAGGDTKEAAAVYRDILNRFPDNLEALYELARVHSISGELTEAIKTYERLLEEIGTDRDIENEILQLYVRLGDEDGMERVLKQMIEDQPHDARLQRMLGEIYMGQNRPEEAVRLLEKALESNPSDVDVLLSLTDVYRSTGKADSADALLERAANFEAATPEELLAQAASLYARSREDAEARETAVQLLNRVLEMDAENADALVMLGDIRTTEGRYEEAADLLYRALDVNPRDPNLWVQAAGAYLQSGNRNRAVDVADEGLMLFPGFLPLLRLSGYALMDAYRNKEAISRFEEAVATIREDRSESRTELTEMLGALALLYTRTKNMEAAERAYLEAIETDPNNATVLNNYAYLLADQGRELDKALEMAKQAVDLSPEVASFLDTLGWAYFKKGEYEAALEWISRATQLQGPSAAVFEHLGDVHQALGNGAGASEAWEAALKMNPTSTSLKKKLGRD